MSAQDAWKRALNHREFWCVKAARRVARTVSLNPRRSPAPNLRTRIPIPTILGKPAQNDRDQTGSAIQSSSIHIGFHDARPVCMASSCADLAGRRHQFTLQAYAQKKMPTTAAKLFRLAAGRRVRTRDIYLVLSRLYHARAFGWFEPSPNSAPMTFT